MQVRDLMSKPVICVSTGETVAYAAKLLSRHGIGSIPVCSDDGSLEGIVTDRDIVTRCIAAGADPAATKVDDIMTGKVYTVTPSDDISKASELMAKAQVRRLPVTESGDIVGMLSLADLAKTHLFNTEASRALSEISTNIRYDK